MSDASGQPAADASLSLPLDGVQAIEASAGTGKTFTLATLVLRQVLEQGLSIGEILVMTFTEAATQELRARIRKRLLLAARLAAGDGLPADASSEAVLTLASIDTHLASGRESRATLQRRLRAAADGIDLAAIFTIHGFCARVLREHALESGQAFDAPELLANDSVLREAIAADLWRAHGTDADAAGDLLTLWPVGPLALAGDLSPLVRERNLRPALAALPGDPAPALRAASHALAAGVRAHGDDFRASLITAVEAKVLNGNSYRRAWIEDLFAALTAWCAAGDAEAPFAHDKLPQLRCDTLLLRTSKSGAGRTPDSPLCELVDHYLDAVAAVERYRDARRVQLLHRVRDDARTRLARHKRTLRVQTYDDLVDRLADALDGPHAAELVARLRAQYRVALVDEFQDTDPRQWRIFDRVFGAGSVADGHAPALFVIGDPKQAIYGFRGGDVDTYLDARASALQAPPLSRNFRSRPGVLRAVDALYTQAGDTAFVDHRIRFQPVAAGGSRSDADYLRDGLPAPALTVWRAPQPPAGDDGKHKPYSAPRSRELATQACVAAIHRVLVDARAGNAMLGDRPVQPGDIAVLVRSHNEATRIRQALAAVGIPAVAAGRLSLFETSEARELHVLLLAVLHGADDGRLRTALSTVLVGVDAAAIAAFDASAGGDALRAWQLQALDWRERLQRGGPLALVGDLCARHAQRLLGLLDGERRLTNYLQLAELLQQAQQRALGLHGLVDWLARRIADADRNDETQQLRLESDARRVQIVTLHKSKGLEYPLVFLPFAGIGRNTPSAGQHVTVRGDVVQDDIVHDGGTRVLHWNLQAAGHDWSAAKQAWIDAQRAEDARLLYVGLTRARDALWLASGAFFNHARSPQWAMAGNADALAARAPDAIVIDDTAPPVDLPWLPPQAEGTVPAPRTPQRRLASDWWVYSFTQLAHADAGSEPSSAATQPAPGGQDEPAASEDDASLRAEPADQRFGGTRFGVVLHDVLEHADFARWRAWTPGSAPPDDERARIVEALRAGGYAASDLDDGVGALTPLIGHTLTVALPEGVALADLPPQARRAEIEFQFSMAPVTVDAVLALLHQHGLLPARQGFGARRRLEGLMTGLIDLTYQFEGRWYVLDYKSNRLPAYDAAHMAQAMAHSEYDLQALIYTLALHRWLRFRLGSASDHGGYDYARDFGGIRYLFCRGLDANRGEAGETSPGIHAQRFAPELVHALDALFGTTLPPPAHTAEGTP